MRATDILRRRVDLVLERNRYRKALRQIVTMKDDRDNDERDARDITDAVAVAEYALRTKRSTS